MANCRGMLGVEAGVSVFDLEGKARPRCEQLLRERPAASFEEVAALALATGKTTSITGRSARGSFEAAAFRVCQILFEGRYNGTAGTDDPLPAAAQGFLQSGLGPVSVRRPSNPATDRRPGLCGSDRLRRVFFPPFHRAVRRGLRQAGIEPAADPAALRQATDFLDQGRRLRALRARIQDSTASPLPGQGAGKGRAQPPAERRPQAAD